MLDPALEVRWEAILTDALRDPPNWRLVNGWRVVATAMTPWRLAVRAARVPTSRPWWCEQAQRPLLQVRRGRRGARRSFSRRPWC